MSGSVTDTGTGIPPELMDKIFDPFFTTKPVGKGTGQGLAISRSIVVEKHGGTLRFEPNQPQGTIFYISIPVNPQPAGGLAAGTGVEQGLKEESETDSVCRR